MRSAEERFEETFRGEPCYRAEIGKESYINAKLAVLWLIKIDNIKDLDVTRKFPIHLFRNRPGFSEIQKRDIQDMKTQALIHWEKLWESYDFANSKLRKVL